MLKKIKHRLTGSQMNALNECIILIDCEEHHNNLTWTMVLCLFAEIQYMIALKCVIVKPNNLISFTYAQAASFNLLMEQYVNDLTTFEKNVVQAVINMNDLKLKSL